MWEMMVMLNWSSLPWNETSLNPLFWTLFNDFLLFLLLLLFFFAFSSVALTWYTREDVNVWSGKFLNYKKRFLSSV